MNILHGFRKAKIKIQASIKMKMKNENVETGYVAFANKNKMHLKKIQSETESNYRVWQGSSKLITYLLLTASLISSTVFAIW